MEQYLTRGIKIMAGNSMGGEKKKISGEKKQSVVGCCEEGENFDPL